MDTGLLYRAVALNLWRLGGDPGNEFEAVRACDVAQVDPDDPELRSEPFRRIASPISAYPRSAPPCSTASGSSPSKTGGAVLDGRDIGTVIAPDADAKLFVTATRRSPRPAPRSRTARSAGMPAHYDDVLTDIRARDERDSGRDGGAVAPGRRRDAARYQRADVEQAIAAAIRLVEERLANG